MTEEIILLKEDFDSNDKVIWERPMTLALIEEYKRFEFTFQDPSVKKKLVWKNIAARLHARGYSNVTDDACDKKWRNLKKTFKDIYTGQRRKNNGKWAYYDILEDVLGRDPKILNALVAEQANAEPLHAIGKQPVIHKYKTADGQSLHVEVMDIGDLPEEIEEQDVCDLTHVITTEDEEDSLEAPCQPYEEEQNTSDEQQRSVPPHWFTEFINEYRSDEERRLELLQSMHSDILAIEKRKLELLEKMLEKFDSPSVKTV